MKPTKYTPPSPSGAAAPQHELPRAVLYLRIAREDHYGGGESASAREQHEASRRLAAEMGLQLEDFADPDTSAGQTGDDAR